MCFLNQSLMAVSIFLIAYSPVPARGDDWKKLNSEVVRLYHAGKYTEAIEIAKRVLALTETQLGPDHPDVGQSLNNLALLYNNQGRTAEAEALYKRSLDIGEKALGSDHPNVGTTLNNLAELYRIRGRYAQAEPLYKRSLGIRENALGRNHPDVGQSLNNLAALYHSQGRYAEAEPLYKRSLGIREKALGPDHPEVGQSLNNLAELYRSQRRYAEAEPLFKRDIAIGEKASGPDHPKVGTTLNNLALLYQSQDRYSEAEPLYKRSLRIHEKELGPGHPDVGTILNNLASLYRSQGRTAEAETLYKQDLAIGEKALGPYHPDVGLTLSNLAQLYGSEGRTAEAETLYKRALTIAERSFGPDHPRVGVILNNLAAIYAKLGRVEDERAMQERLGKMPSPGTRYLRLYYATNRVKDARGVFNGVVSETLSLGRTVMEVPAEEVMNRAERIGESLGRLEMAKTGKLTAAGVLKPVRVQRFLGATDTYADAVRASQRRAAIFKNQALVFVHGYNNTFAGAMQRATQLSFDLDFDGILMPFTWPSQGTARGYLIDNSHAMQSVDALMWFLDDVRTALPDVKLHFLAHSMGNQVMLRALCKIAERDGNTPANFGQVISAHADVSFEDFETLTECFKNSVEGITLYVNEQDTALGVRCGGSRCRAGNYPRGYSAVDVVDTTAMAKGFWRTLASGFDHDVFVRDPLLFGDITRLLLAGQRPVEKRTQEFRPREDAEGRTYWVYDKTFDPAAASTEVAEQ